MLEDIQGAFHRYGQSIIDGDYKKTVDFMYPKLFKFIPKEGIANSLKSAQSNPSVKISFSDFQIVSTEKSYTIDANAYVVFTSTSKIEMVYMATEKRKDDDDEDEDDETSEIDFTYGILVAKYGKANVKLDRTSNTIRANTTSSLLGIKEKGSWYFLDLKPHWIGLYQKFLPPNIVEDLSTMFPSEEDVPVKTSSKKKAQAKSKKAVDKVMENENVKRIYLAGWDVELDGGEHCEDFIATQITTQETIKHLSTGIELVFENDKLVKAFDYDDGKKKTRRLRKEEIGLAFKKYPENHIYQFTEASKGKHQLGGEAPKGFTIPACNSAVPFQYLGYIDNTDSIFRWLPFKVHLACPIYLNVSNVFVDYSDPMKPEVINREEVQAADTSYDELTKNSEIVFDSTKFNFVEDVEFAYIGNAGIPKWIQASDIPRCPKSGERMKFLCQLNGGVGVKRSNVDDPGGYFDEMNFWGDGDLFVFFQPESKVACYFIQNT
jgi:hypothetical protein